MPEAVKSGSKADDILEAVMFALSDSQVRESLHKQMVEVFDKMCDRYRMGYRERYKGELWVLAGKHCDELRRHMKVGVREGLKKAGLTLRNRVEDNLKSREKGPVVEQGELLRTAVELLKEMQGDDSVPAGIRGQVLGTLARFAESVDVETTQVVVEDFSDAWPDALQKAGLRLDELASDCVRRLTGSKALGKEEGGA